MAITEVSIEMRIGIFSAETCLIYFIHILVHVLCVDVDIVSGFAFIEYLYVAYSHLELHYSHIDIKDGHRYNISSLFMCLYYLSQL